MPFLTNVWSRLRDAVARFIPRKPPEPGRFIADSKFSWRGFLAGAPWLAPQREYLVYVPAGVADRWRFRRHPLLVLLHGCRQTPEDLAAATRVARVADEHRFLVLLPRQNERANSWGCWNWFDTFTSRGWGETAIVAAQIRAVRRSYRINKERVVVAGMSAGGALAAALGIRRPDLVAGVFVHSGIACGAATHAYDAMEVMKRGAKGDVLRIGHHARNMADARTLPVPLLVVQGGSDDIVAPLNAVQLVRQYLAFNGHPAANAGGADALPPADQRASITTADGRVVVTSDWNLDGRFVVRHVLVDGLGHAWSGGDDQYSFNDPRAPDATALLAAFVDETMQ